MKKSINRCPSCGERCLVERHKYSDMLIMHYDAVECKKCGVNGPHVQERTFGYDMNKCKQEAIDLWNNMTSTCPKSLAKPPVTYVDSTLPKDVEPATEKQKKFAKAIAEKTGFKLPVEKSKDNLHAFISEHITKFKAIQESNKSRWRSSMSDVDPDCEFDDDRDEYAECEEW